MDVFLERVRRERGGVISDPKNYIADFVGFITVNFGRKFRKKCLIQKKIIANLRIFANFRDKAQLNFYKIGMEGGSKTV